MPRKRTRAKRHSVEAQRSAWEAVFDTGYDFFDDLPALGVWTDNYSRPDPEDAREAWERFGAGYLQSHSGKDARGGPIWAINLFGRP